MIPKIIHYCWFGRGEMPKSFKENIATWKKYCPDYEFICWDEEKFDVLSVEYVKRAYEMKKYAFVSDYVRLHALYEHGGIYLDTDVELFKPLDRFLEHSFFIGRDFRGKTALSDEIGTGLIASEKNFIWIKELLDIYDTKQLLFDDGSICVKTINWIMTSDAFIRLGFKLDNVLQILNNGAYIYPAEYFSPMDPATRRFEITENTYAIHKFASSWNPRSFTKKLRYKIWDTFGYRGLWTVKDSIKNLWNKN